MESIELSKDVLDICAENYEKNCGGCPIRSACKSDMGDGVVGLNAHAERCNKLAEKLR